jgi:lysophospholipid acyltransferase (LPLAT)-like uncharacterized protein
MQGSYTERQAATVARRLGEVHALAAASGPPRRPTDAERGRGIFTRALDAVLDTIAARAPALEWLASRLTAVVLYLYARVVGVTERLTADGWPDAPAPAILAFWHGSAPAFLCAVARRRPARHTTILVARDSRGDCLALLCRWLGFAVVRGDATSNGWAALEVLAEELARGDSVAITVDGFGPARVVKTGAVALAAATGAPLVAVGAACWPALAERHKWDRARNPVPFGRVAVALAEPITLEPIGGSDDLDAARRRIAASIDSAQVRAERSAGLHRRA